MSYTASYQCWLFSDHNYSLDAGLKAKEMFLGISKTRGSLPPYPHLCMGREPVTFYSRKMYGQMMSLSQLNSILYQVKKYYFLGLLFICF